MADVPSPQLLPALNHPVRRRILRLLLATSDALSPRDLSELLSEPLSNVSYHTRCLEGLGVLQLRNTEPVRGSVKHFYRPTAEVESSRWVRETLDHQQAADDGA